MLKGVLFAELNGEKGIEIEPGFEPGSSGFWSDALIPAWLVRASDWKFES